MEEGSSQSVSLQSSQKQWHMPIIPAFKRLRQEDPEFKASPGYMATPYLLKIKINHQSKHMSLE